MNNNNKKNSALDERQEQKLLHIESKGFWLVFWLLLAGIVIQSVINFVDFLTFEIPTLACEWIIFMIAALYMSIACSKNNIWARTFKPSLGSNLLFSLAAGGIVGGIFSVISYINYHKIIGSICVFIFLVIFAGGLSFAALSIGSAAYEKNVKREEDNLDAEDE